MELQPAGVDRLVADNVHPGSDSADPVADNPAADNLDALDRYPSSHCEGGSESQ